MNSYIVSVNLKSAWVLANSKNGVSDAIERIKKAFSEKQDCTVVLMFNDFSRAKFLVFSEQDVTEQTMKNMCLETITGLGNDEISVNINKVEKDEVKSIVVDCPGEFDEKVKAFLKEYYGIDTNLSETEKKLSKEGNSVDELICFDPLKNWVSEVTKMAGKFGGRLKDSGVFTNLTYLIAVNRGNGRSTILRTMASVLEKTGLIEYKDQIDICEKKLMYSEPDPRAMVDPSVASVIDTISKGFTGIMAIDISEWLGHLDDRRFDMVLDIVSDLAGHITFVFFVPYIEQSVFEKVRLRLDDVVSTRTMQFVPPSDDQYFVYFRKLIGMNGIEVSEEVYPIFAEKITEERNDGRFYSFNTVRKMANELMYGIISDAARKDTEIPSAVGIKELSAVYKLDDSAEISGLDQLGGMVALNDVKNKVKEILATLKLQKRMFKDGAQDYKPCYHMMFTGNPGTGKTVVARIVGRIFKEEGLLSVGNFYEVSRKDFVGQYVGHTAPKTMEICRNAYGSVLFIDEAYMLADEHDGYSKEAIGTLIAEMENNRDKMVVIFAGYEKELGELFEMNPGLRDRVPHMVNFPNYTRDELKEIFYLQLGGKMEYDDSFKAAADKYFATLSDEIINEKTFSNGRFVRNLVERIISKAALRFEMQQDACTNYVLTENDFTLAVAVSDAKTLSEKQDNIRRIGF